MDLTEKARKVNEKLTSYGAAAIQKYDTGNFKAIGYKPQYIIDALNDVVGAGNWKHTVKSVERVEVPTKAGSRLVVVAEATVSFLENGNVIFETGSQYGSGNIISGNIGDGVKGAVTDAIGKALSLLSVGNEAYRGSLKQFEAQAEDVTVKDEPYTPSNDRFKSGAGTKPVIEGSSVFKAEAKPSPAISAEAGGLFKASPEIPGLTTSTIEKPKFKSSGSLFGKK